MQYRKMEKIVIDSMDDRKNGGGLPDYLCKVKGIKMW